MSNSEEIPEDKSKSPQSAVWQWPTCNCSEEELRHLLPSNSRGRRPNFRRRVTDTIASFSQSAKRGSYFGALSTSQSPALADALLEEQQHPDNRNGASLRKLHNAQTRRLALWLLSTFVLVMVAFAEGVWLYHSSNTCARSCGSALLPQHSGQDGLQNPLPWNEESVFHFPANEVPVPADRARQESIARRIGDELRRQREGPPHVK